MVLTGTFKLDDFEAVFRFENGATVSYERGWFEAWAAGGTKLGARRRLEDALDFVLDLTAPQAAAPPG